MAEPLPPAVPAATAAQAAFCRKLLTPWQLRLYLLRHLPMAYLAGLRVRALTPTQAAVTISYKYLTKNPFRSIYFACLSMAAELASGVLALLHLQGAGRVSMLVVGLEATFTKKATGRIVFTCPDGALLAQAIADSRATGAGRTARCTSTGHDAAGDVVAVFRITWSFRAK